MRNLLVAVFLLFLIAAEFSYAGKLEGKASLSGEIPADVESVLEVVLIDMPANKTLATTRISGQLRPPFIHFVINYPEGEILSTGFYSVEANLFVHGELVMTGGLILDNLPSDLNEEIEIILMKLGEVKPFPARKR